MTGRLFVAVRPPPAAVADLLPVVARAAALLPGARWLDPDRWHLTLRYLGDVDPVPAGAVLHRMPARAPITLRLSGAGTFGWRHPSVLWVGCAGDTDGLRALADDVDDVLAGDRDQPFRAHLTVARTGRSPHPVGAAVGVLAAVHSAPFTVTEIQLVRSSDGTQETLQWIPL